MNYKGFAIDVTTKPSTSGSVREVSYQVRRAGEATIVFSGMIGSHFRSEKVAANAALLKVQTWIDNHPVRSL